MTHWERIRGDGSVVTRTILAGERIAGNVVSWQDGDERLVGYWIGRDHWGKGIATAALAAFLRVEERRPLHARVAAHNLGSARVLEKCGFARRGMDDEGPLFRLDAPANGL